MRNLGFLKKELKESIKTSRFIVIISVFLFFSIFSTLGARYMNEIMEAFASDFKIEFPEPVYLDSWVQFFKNTTSICYIIFLLIMTGTVVSEKTKGSIMLVLSKNVSRTNFILSKIFAGTIIFTVAYVISAIACSYYTHLLFPAYSNDKILFSLFLLWILGVFYGVLGVFISVVSKTATVSAIFGFITYAVLNIITTLPQISMYTPAGISSIGTDLMKESIGFEKTLTTLFITLFLTIALIFLSTQVFRKQEI